ncbi:MAG: hypothetical protein ACR5LD_03845 [Symbiopectobacterium sp.]
MTKSNNTFRPILANSSNLSNYTLPRDRYYGKKGTVLKAYPASSDFLLSYARTYTKWYSVSPIGWICKYRRSAPGKGVSVNVSTKNSDPYAIFR